MPEYALGFLLSLGILARMMKIIVVKYVAYVLLWHAASQHRQPLESCAMPSILYINFLQKSSKIEMPLGLLTFK